MLNLETAPIDKTYFVEPNFIQSRDYMKNAFLFLPHTRSVTIYVVEGSTTLIQTKIAICKASI